MKKHHLPGEYRNNENSGMDAVSGHKNGFMHENGECCHHHEGEEGCHHDHGDSDSCECGHSHDHAEGESCGCEHHHDHAEGESCGCEHHHDHAEGESCGCEHHHDHAQGGSCGHHHEHGEGCGHHHGGNQVMTGVLDDHKIGVMTAFTAASLPVTEVNMNLSLKDIYYFIIEEGGQPIQLKASMKDNKETVLMNMIGSDIFRSSGQESTEKDPSKVKVKIQVIADKINERKLKVKLEEIMGYFAENSF